MNYLKKTCRTIIQFSAVIISASMLLSVTSCQSWTGNSIKEVEEKYAEFPSAPELYSFYQMCLAAWREREQYKESTWNLEYVSHPETNTLGLFIEEGETLYMVFRATQAPKNPIDSALNSNYSLKPLFFLDYPSSDSSGAPVMKAHAGIQEKYAGIRDAVLQRTEGFKGKQTVLVGHSAGGMTAMIAYLDLKTMFPEMEFLVITFGMPRVLNITAARVVDADADRVFRFAMAQDFLVTIPPAFLGYRHAGTKILLGRPSILYPYTVEAHETGYLMETERRLREAGFTPEELGF
jgi:hypothetical protein